MGGLHMHKFKLLCNDVNRPSPGLIGTPICLASAGGRSYTGRAGTEIAYIVIQGNLPEASWT
jgi:hypothetical protein